MITLSNLTLRRGNKVLLENASAVLHAGEKVGLVGRNGSGKSSLLALLQGELLEDSGSVTLPADWRIAQVEQEMPDSEQSATAFVLAGDSMLMAAQEQLADAEHSDDGIALAQAHSDFADAGGHDARARAEALILGIGFTPAQLALPVNHFSGGWRMRLQLARALMAPSDLLLLDEPTNHLDLDALIWLEGWLARYPGTLIVISHDREFLDAATGVTLHIEHGQLRRHQGNYSAFERQRAEQLRLQQAQFSRQQREAARLEQFIARFRAKASKARQAQSRIKALARMERVAPVLAESDFQLEFAEPESLPDPMLVMEDGILGYAATPPEDPALIVLRSVQRTVRARQRIGILGANGQGKSTFIKTIAHALPLQGGTLAEGKGLRIGYFAQQELDILRAEDSALQHLIRLARQTGRQDTEAAREQKLRDFLGGFAFPGEMVRQPVGQFSGGEKARLALAMIVWQRPNLLLLDEPTNHLDLATREALALALAGFEGTLMLVSHDRALLKAVCDEYWLVANGTITSFSGDLADYHRYLSEHSRSSTPSTKPGGHDLSSTAPDQLLAKGPRNRTELRRAQARRREEREKHARPYRTALADAERRIDVLQTQKTALEEQLLQPMPPQQIAEAARQIKHTNAELERLEEEWLELAEQLEILQQAGPD